MKRAGWCTYLAGLTLWTPCAFSLLGQAPGRLLSSRQEALGKVIAGTTAETQRPSLPSSARELPVLTCVYSDGAGGTNETHHWLGASPPWHGAIPVAHPLNKLVQSAVKACPPAVSPAAIAAAAGLTAKPAAAAPVEEPPVRAAIPLPSFELTAADFKTQGMEYQSTFHAIYAGNFRDVPFERDTAELRVTMNSYIVAFSNNCRSFLRGDVVQVTNWNQQAGVVVYAEADLLDARRQLERIGAGRALGDAFSMLTDGGQKMLRMARNGLALKSEVEDLIGRNGCESRGLRRFRDNLRLFALDEKPIRLAQDGGAPAPPKPPSRTAANQNYTRLIDELIGANSRSWAMNRYIAGSATGARVISRDGDGNPRRVEASYTFNGMQGRASGSVILEFSEDRPKCLYFFDFPAVCRVPDRQIVTAYEQGRFATRE
ncbi:MAG: hypothetical protein FJW30_08965 [Acidobacteria bacterium]|nr:hypothetical protein [Acidobacteriota bacterium]